MQIPEIPAQRMFVSAMIPAQRKFVSSVCHAHYNAHKPRATPTLTPTNRRNL